MTEALCGDLMPETAERFDLLEKKRNSGGLSDVETARLKELNAQLVLSKLVTGRYTAEETSALAKEVLGLPLEQVEAK